MKVYVFWTHEDEWVAKPSLKKAIAARAKLYGVKDRPEILQITIPTPITRTMVCNLLMRKDYAEEMRDIA